jgi:small subunit ribosomal protein S21
VSVNGPSEGHQWPTGGTCLRTTERVIKGVSSNCPSRTWSGLMRVAEVRLQDGESVENALRRFKRKVQAEDIIGEVKRHSYYLKPGEKRRVKQALARKRARKKLRKESE